MKPNQTKGDAATEFVDALLDDDEADLIEDLENRRQRKKWVSQALAVKFVEPLSYEPNAGIVRVRICAIETIITISIEAWRDGRFSVVPDHAILTPIQASSYTVREDPFAFPGAALYRTFLVFRSFYRSAVEKGHRPHPSWWTPIAR
jgi:hypothetical protein